jgi:DNA-binding ferritin-like protein (Dps family)
MKLSELKHAIREMIVSELVEVSADDVKRQQQYNTELEKTKELMDDLVTEEDLYEMATFYKVKPEAGAEAKQAIAKAQEKFREGSALYNTLDLLKTKGEVDYKELAAATGKDIATFNNPKSREVLEKDLAAFIDVAAGKKGAGSSEPKEPREPGRKGRPKGSIKTDDSIAYTMGSDVKVVGKDPSKSLIKRAVKAARSVQPISTINTTDLDAVEAQLKAINSELETKLPKAKEIAAKGNVKNYTEEETAFMDDVRTKSGLRKQLIATRDKIVSKRVRR